MQSSNVYKAQKLIANESQNLLGWRLSCPFTLFLNLKLTQDFDVLTKVSPSGNQLLCWSCLNNCYGPDKDCWKLLLLRLPVRYLLWSPSQAAALFLFKCSECLLPCHLHSLFSTWQSWFALTPILHSATAICTCVARTVPPAVLKEMPFLNTSLYDHSELTYASQVIYDERSTYLALRGNFSVKEISEAFKHSFILLTTQPLDFIILCFSPLKQRPHFSVKSLQCSETSNKIL